VERLKNMGRGVKPESTYRFYTELNVCGGNSTHLQIQWPKILEPTFI
jgi:hypothetical protein